MSVYKISDFQAFKGQQLLLDAQRRGAELFVQSRIQGLDATSVMLIGLAAILVEKGILQEITPNTGGDLNGPGAGSNISHDAGQPPVKPERR